MRWLLLKDVRILRRSRLLLGLLVAYPLLLALLVGAALSAGPQKPRVAFANLVPPGAGTVQVGGKRVDAASYAARLFRSVRPVRVSSRAEAIAEVRSGRALAALVIPADAIDRLQGTLGLAGGSPPAVEVFYNAEDPVKQRYVEAVVRTRLADANAALSDAVLREAATYLRILVRGGAFDLPLVGRVDVLGLERTRDLVRSAQRALPEGSEERLALERVARFADLAADNLDLSRPILASIGRPVQIRQTVVAGARTPLDTFAVAVSVIVSLMLVGLLLGAGLLALEREEQVFGRLVRALVSRETLLAAKIALAAACASAVGVVLLGGLAVFVDLQWRRAPLWLLAIVAACVAFAALGTAIGAAASDVRAAALLCTLLALPVAFLALVPSGAVAPGLFDLARLVSGALPFRPGLAALQAALGGGALVPPLLHLLALSAAFAVAARILLQRF